MLSERTTYITDRLWTDLIEALNANSDMRLLLGVKQCPFTGMVEEYTLADRLGGELDIWPTKWRNQIEESDTGE